MVRYPMQLADPELTNPLRYWHDQPLGFPTIDAADAEADREDSLSDRYAFKLGEDLGLCRIQAPDEWPSPEMARGYQYGLTRAARHADVYLRKLLRLRVNAYARGLPVSTAITTDYLRQITVTVCPVSGTPLTQGTLSDSDWSIDRLANNLGYVPGNICFLSTRVNRIKGTADLDDLLDGGAARAWLMPGGLDLETNFGLRTVEVLRLAALVAAPASMARGAAPREFPPLAMAPAVWMTPQCKLGALHVACARTRLETPAQRLRATWLKRSGPDVWRCSNRLVDKVRRGLDKGTHPCDLWLDQEMTSMLLEITDAFFANPPPLPRGLTPDDALKAIKAGMAPVATYLR